MPTLKCQSCGGVYLDVLLDGTHYFHSCPPLSAPELAAAVKAQLVTLPKDETVADAIARRRYVRKAARDENVIAGHVGDGPAPMKAPGKGTAPAPAIDPAIDQAPVIVDV